MSKSDPGPSSLHELIKRLREKGLTIAEISWTCGVPSTTIQALLLRELPTSPTVDELPGVRLLIRKAEIFNEEIRLLEPCNEDEPWKLIQALRGGFHVNGDTIAFDTNGWLRNGQHRLRAISETNTPVLLMVVWGVDPDCFGTYDSHSRRGSADALGIAGYVQTHCLAVALSWQQAYEEQCMTNRQPIPSDVAVAFAAEHPELTEAIRSIRRYPVTGLIPQGLATFLWFQFSDRDEDLCKQFFDRVVLRIGVTERSHEYRLIRRLVDQKTRIDEQDPESGRTRSGVKGSKRMKLPEEEIAALCIKTWNKLRTNDPVVKTLIWRENEGFPAII